MKWNVVFSISVSIVIVNGSFVERPTKVVDAIKIIKQQSPSDHTEMKTFCKDPYGICKKKMPYGNDFQKIITRSLCKWKRTYFKAPTPMFDGEAHYTNGKDSVFMLFSLQRDSGSRVAVFKTIKVESIEGNNLVAKEEPPADPAWLQVGKDRHVFFAWTRKNYIFSCESNQGWRAIDSFMNCFPY